jgi:hypothetical protein
MERRKILPLSRRELWTLGRPACSQSLYRLRYPGSQVPIKIPLNSEYLVLGGLLKIQRITRVPISIYIYAPSWSLKMHLSAHGRILWAQEWTLGNVLTRWILINCHCVRSSVMQLVLPSASQHVNQISNPPEWNVQQLASLLFGYKNSDYLILRKYFWIRIWLPG